MKPGSAWTKHRLTFTVTAATTIAVALITVAVVHTWSITNPQGWQLVLAFMALLIADSALVDIRTGSDSESVTFAEAMLAVSLVLVPWAYLLPLAGFAVTV